MEKLAVEYEATWRFVAVNAETHEAAAEEFGVQSLPTLIMFENGEESFRFDQGVALSPLAAKLEELTNG